MSTSSRRVQAEEHRRSVERALRPNGATPEDRDVGLEEAWHRRMAGMRLVGQQQALDLRTDGSYRAQFADETEAGTWLLTSCVGRVSLMLTPREGARYGFMLRRDGQMVVLNDENHTVTPLSGL